MKTSIIEKAYAKINLHLDVTGIMSDGYHAVSTVMQTLSLCDVITVSDIKKTDASPVFSVSCNLPGVPCDERNLAVKAARLFCEETGLSLSAHINIEKHIPMAAGMAGGSTDGAAVLRGLNKACGEPLTVDSLCALGARLGADVPVCIVGGTRCADGRGDILHDFPRMPDCHVVVACEGEGVSTPWAYRLLDDTYNNFSDEAYAPKDTNDLRAALTSGDVTRVAKNIYNIFEAPILAHRPVAAQIKEILLSSGADGAMMSGSGPSVFGIFENEENAKKAAELLESRGFKAHICRPV